MKKILFLSDIHYSSGSNISHQRWFPGFVKILAGLPGNVHDKFLRHWDNFTQKQLELLLTKVGIQEFTSTFCLGDIIAGEQESGMLTPQSLKEAKFIMSRLRQPSMGGIHIVLGNHDVGYKRARKNSLSRGMTQLSIDRALQTFNTKLFYSKLIEGFNFIALTSSLITDSQAIKSDELKNSQNEFLAGQLKSNRRNIILLHDPRALRDGSLNTTISNNIDNIEYIVFGDLHSRFVGKLFSLPYSFRRKMIPIASTMGLAGFSCGYSELTLSKGELDWRHHRLKSTSLAQKPQKYLKPWLRWAFAGDESSKQTDKSLS